MRLTRKTIAKVIVAAFLLNLAVMGAGAWLAYQEAPPIPDEVVGPDGETIVTGAEVQDGKEAFQQYGLMNHGSILGNGAYYGEDYTADALELKVEHMREYYADAEYGAAYDDLASGEQSRVDALVRDELDAAHDGGDVVEYSAAEVYAHRQVRETYVERYHEGDHDRGVPAGMIGSAEEARNFADFALWTAWFSHTDRPNADHSYTNEWPYAPGAGNDATGSAMTWSVIAMVLLVGAAGAAILLYKSVKLPEPSSEGISVPKPGDVSVFPSQRAALRFIPIAAGLFLAQVLLGGLLAHFYIERAGFFGIERVFGIHVLQLLPFAIAKTWHIDLGILWIASTWLGAGLFLPPLLTGHEPKRQGTYVSVLLGALVVVVVGGMSGIWLGANGYLPGELWWLLGNEGLEYLEVGKVWQAGLLGGFILWAVLAIRGLKPLLDREPVYGLAHMILYAGGSITLLFVAGFMFTPSTNIAVTEFWRWWVVHMWVEGAFEFFIVAIIGLTLVSMNLLSRRSAEKAVMLQALLVMGTGVVGVSHHYWWIGMPDYWVPIGSVFSTLELLPLIFILYEAIGQYRAMAETGFPYKLPFMFIVASGVWNFVGAGVLGFFINLPLINYYEHGTYLTVGHAHAAMFGAFGFLALGMVTYMLQLSIDPERWDGSWLRASFWCWNVGLALMVFVSVLPVGFLQLDVAFTESYAAARSLAFYERDIVQTLFWARLPGDTLIIAGTAIYVADLIRKRFVLRASEDDPTVDDMAVAEGIVGDDD
ncbi:MULTISPECIES: nitric-oxide reductase large subunit [Halorubrum]|uniref:Nitric oxide reductase, NorZ apoprotein n=1 Tax=Halorubrum sodomense TaxID=35743 RepID=A0A1I6FLY0_HALSD|nr:MULTISPECIES: cbb3-type cytochrome c oxidase subunit I [Halorubrum]TKX68310.1 cytochrome B [Halorubrum sp. SP9]SFR30941.1 nitric oxide reductase, NorZ apoprotein [Halorubrum sodomense]